MRRLFILAMVLLGACSSGGPAPIHPSGVASSGRASVTAQRSSFTRPCRSSVYGKLGNGWHQEALVIGPVAFIGLNGLATAAPSRFMPQGRRDQSEKVLAVVNAGPPVTVRVSPPSNVALLYDFSKFHSRNVASGDSDVTFVPCKPGKSPLADIGARRRTTQFNGAVIVSGPECVAIDVSVRGETPLRRWVSFGAGSHCPV